MYDLQRIAIPGCCQHELRRPRGQLIAPAEGDERLDPSPPESPGAVAGRIPSRPGCRPPMLIMYRGARVARGARALARNRSRLVGPARTTGRYGTYGRPLRQGRRQRLLRTMSSRGGSAPVDPERVLDVIRDWRSPYRSCQPATTGHGCAFVAGARPRQDGSCVVRPGSEEFSVGLGLPPLGRGWLGSEKTNVSPGESETLRGCRRSPVLMARKTSAGWYKIRPHVRVRPDAAGG